MVPEARAFVGRWKTGLSSSKRGAQSDSLLRNEIKANSGARSLRFYRPSTRLLVPGKVARVALWKGFCLGGGWYLRLERLLVDGRLDYHLPREVHKATRLRRTYCGRLLSLRNQVGSNKPSTFDSTRLRELWG